MPTLPAFTRPLVFSLLLAAAGAAQAAAPRYELVPLPSLGGVSDSVAAMNARGEVVGVSYVQTAGDGGRGHAVWWRDGAVIDLSPGAELDSWAYGIGDTGVIAGIAWTVTGPAAFRSVAVRWDGTAPTLLGAVGGPLTQAWSVSPGGVVVGRRDTATGLEAVRWDGTVASPLGAAGLDPLPYAAADNGLIVGVSGRADGVYRYATAWQGGVATELPGTGLLESSTAYGLNEAGVIVGSRQTGIGTEAVRWFGGTATALPTLYPDVAAAFDVNAGGVIVGASTFDDNPFRPTHAVGWFGTTVVDLNDVVAGRGDWTLIRAVAVNDAGWIAGVAETPAGSRGFVLRPVPEPSTLALWLAGAALLVAARRFRPGRPTGARAVPPSRTDRGPAAASTSLQARAPARS